LEGKSGLELLEIFAQKEPISNRVIVISSHVDEANQIKGYDLGVSNFVQKPINPKILKSIMRKNLKMLDQALDDNIAFKNLILYPGKQALESNVGGDIKHIQLTYTEYRIALQLIKQRGGIVAKEDLTFSGKDDSKEMSFKALEMHISYLRKKLDLINGPLIKAKWGVGYFLSDRFKKEAA